MENDWLIRFSKKVFMILKYISFLGLFLFLAKSFEDSNIEPIFWIMGISLALSGLLIINKNKEIKEISKNLILSTFGFIFSFCRRY